MTQVCCLLLAMFSWAILFCKSLLNLILLLDTQFDWLKEAALCVDFLNDDCVLNETCILLHNPYKTSYLWQHKNIDGTSWTNFDKDTNENIEETFCDPSKTISDSCKPEFQIYFMQIPTIDKTHFTNVRFFKLFRRLSTRSSVIDNKIAKPGVTHWKWYWEKSKNMWEEYKFWVGFFFTFFSLIYFFKKICVFLNWKMPVVNQVINW